jgi:hypothetical protein
MLLQLQDFGTSLWQLRGYAISLPWCLKGRGLLMVRSNAPPTIFFCGAGGGYWPDSEAPASFPDGGLLRSTCRGCRCPGALGQSYRIGQLFKCTGEAFAGVFSPNTLGPRARTIPQVTPYHAAIFECLKSA